MKTTIYAGNYQKEVLDLLNYFNNNKKELNSGRVDKTFVNALVNIENEIANTYQKFDDIELGIIFKSHNTSYSINELYFALNGTERNEVINLIDKAAKTNDFEVSFSFTE